MKITRVLSSLICLSLLVLGNAPAQADTITSSFAVGSVGGTFYTWGPPCPSWWTAMFPE